MKTKQRIALLVTMALANVMVVYFALSLTIGRELTQTQSQMDQLSLSISQYLNEKIPATFRRGAE